MGTNYYWFNPQDMQRCHECMQETPRPLHIGKSSGGWCFALHVLPEEDIHTLADWIEKFKVEGSYIKSEYGDIVTVSDMEKNITDRSWPTTRPWTPQDYKINTAEPGPNGLVRHKVDGVHCVGQGAGTYDYITGWFR